MPDKPSLTIMADTRGRWLWSHDMSKTLLPDDTIFQANLWLEKYAYFCEHPDDIHLRGQFNAEGMNLARQVQLFLGSDVEVSYTNRHPNRKVKKGINRRIIIEDWLSLYSGDPCSKVDVYKPLSLMDFIFERCEDDGSIAKVEADYYQYYITMADEEIRDLIRLLIFSMAPTINKIDQWKSDDALLDRLRITLFMIMRGIMFLPENGGEPVFCKPTRMPTDDEIEQLHVRADSELETIREVFENILHEQEEAIT